jgi:glyoxylase-like metal-dependent hydrolase (beta-lactamase superfamily II)
LQPDRGMNLIDVRHLGRERVIGCWEIDGVLIDPGPTSSLENLIEALGGAQPRALLLTHIHLDHAGASGSMVRRWPDLPVYVHEIGARHLADPSKLLASAERLYGDEMDRLWGEVAPVPQQNLKPLRGGEEVFGFRVAYTPGHASHHVSYFHEPTGTAFTGDAAGVRIADGPVAAPTPPPDIDLDAWRASIDRIEAWRPSALVPTHFGRFEDVEAHLDGLRAYLDEWGAKARQLDQDAWIAAYRGRIAGASEIPAIEQAMPVEQQYAGLERYWSLQA